MWPAYRFRAGIWFSLQYRPMNQEKTSTWLHEIFSILPAITKEFSLLRSSVANQLALTCWKQSFIEDIFCCTKSLHPCHKRFWALESMSALRKFVGFKF